MIDVGSYIVGTHFDKTNSECALIFFYPNALSQEISCSFHVKYDCTY